MRKRRLTWSDRYIPTREDMIKENRRHQEYERLGIDMKSFSSNHSYTKDELIAMQFIAEEKQIPTEIEARLLATREERLNARVINEGTFVSITDEELEDFLK